MKQNTNLIIGIALIISKVLICIGIWISVAAIAFADPATALMASFLATAATLGVFAVGVA